MSNDERSPDAPETLAHPKNGGVTYALLIGVDKYFKAGSLHFCQNDVNLFSDCLVKYVGIDKDNIRCLNSSYEWLHILPLHHIIDYWLDYYIGKAKVNDNLIVLFSGHGFEIGGVSYLAPMDLIINEKNEYKTDTAISFNDLAYRMNKCNAKFKWLIIDACRDQVKQAKGCDLQPFGVGKLSIPKRSVVFQSCKSGEISIEDEYLEHSIFIHTLVEALKGSADYNADGKITMEDVVRYVEEETPKRARVERINCEQTPCCFIADLNPAEIIVSDKTEGLTPRQLTEGKELILKARKLLEVAESPINNLDAEHVLIKLRDAIVNVDKALGLQPDPHGTFYRDWTNLRNEIQKEISFKEREKGLDERERRLNEREIKLNQKDTELNKLTEQLTKQNVLMGAKLEEGQLGKTLSDEQTKQPTPTHPQPSDMAYINQIMQGVYKTLYPMKDLPKKRTNLQDSPDSASLANDNSGAAPSPSNHDFDQENKDKRS